MISIRDDAEGGINTLIQEQAAVPGEITVSLYQFDTQYEKVFGPIPASQAPKYHLVPRGGTALIDATARAIVETGEYLSSLPEDQRPERVVFIVATDGQENSSREYTTAQLKEMIETQTNQYNWEFIYLGANVDAFAESQKYGITTSTQYQGTGASVRATYAGASSSLSNARVRGASARVADSMPTNVDAEGNAS